MPANDNEKYLNTHKSWRRVSPGWQHGNRLPDPDWDSESDSDPDLEQQIGDMSKYEYEYEYAAWLQPTNIQ